MAEQGQNEAAVESNVQSGANAPGDGELVPFMERPQWVPEKFYKDGHVNFKELAKSYGELEGKQGQPPANQPAPQPQGKTPPPPQNEQAPNNQPPADVTIPGVAAADVQRYTQEMVKDGKLSDTSYTELAKLGYPKSVVDMYVKGMTADATAQAAAQNAVQEAKIADKHIEDITNSIGGQKNLEAMLQWATANLAPEDLKAYNDAVSGSNATAVKLAVRGLYQSFQEAQGPDLLDGKRPADVSNIQPFTSNDEVVEAMSDPRYDRDQSYRDKVAARIAVSSVFGQSREYKTRSDYQN